MTNLKTLDLSDNIDMYKPREMLAREAQQRAEGSGQAFDFLENKHDRDEILINLPSLEHLTCDLILEVYIIENIQQKQFLPNLKTINRVSVRVTDLGERTREKKVLELSDNLWKYVNQYRLTRPGAVDEDPTFYVHDEVGCAIVHSDTPNVKLLPFIYSPNAQMEDPRLTAYSVLWVTEEINKDAYLYRDYLYGVTEAKFRSARLYPWFNVFQEYYNQEYEKFVVAEPEFDAIERHNEYQTGYPCPSIIDWDIAKDGPIPVYTDYARVAEYLRDPRFKIVEDHSKAKILWLTGDYEQKRFLEWNIDES